MRYILPRKAEGLTLAGMKLAVQEFQTFPPRQRMRANAQPAEVSCHLSLHPFQTWPGGPGTLGLYAEGDKPCPHHAVVAAGELLRQHIHILLPEIVKGIAVQRNIPLTAVVRARATVDERQLERQGAVKGIEQSTVPVKNGGLIVGVCQLIGDVLKLNTFCV